MPMNYVSNAVACNSNSIKSALNFGMSVLPSIFRRLSFKQIYFVASRVSSLLSSSSSSSNLNLLLLLDFILRLKLFERQKSSRLRDEQENI